MPIVVKKKPDLPPITAAVELVQAPIERSAVDVDAKLTAHSAQVGNQLYDMALAMTSAMAAHKPVSGPPPAWDFAVKYGMRGEIVSIRATPVQQ